jgi:hypothetical protein
MISPSPEHGSGLQQAGDRAAPAVWFAYSRQIAEANIRTGILRHSRARCELMLTLASTGYTTAAVLRKQLAGRMCGASSSTLLVRIADSPVNRIAELLPWKMMPSASLVAQSQLV